MSSQGVFCDYSYTYSAACLLFGDEVRGLIVCFVLRLLLSLAPLTVFVYLVLFLSEVHDSVLIFKF